MSLARHVPVMVERVIHYLNPQPGATIVDCTIGGGGHAEAILSHLLPGGRLIGIEQDSEALARCRERFSSRPEVTLVKGNFRDLAAILESLEIAKADGFLFDLGVSSDQLESAQRGFSFRWDGPLDMRMDQQSEVTAAQLVRRLPEAELSRILWEGGEERWAKRLARAITTSRQKSQITTTAQLHQMIIAHIPAAAHAARIDPATRAFQALRMAVNDELAALAAGLEATIAQMQAHGRTVVLSYHSKEDGVTKGTFRRHARKCQCPPLLPTCACSGRPQVRILTRKPETPTAEEVARNPRSRSARLRAVEKI